MLGLVVPSVANPFWGAFAQLVESSRCGRTSGSLLCNSERDPARESEYLEELWADGIGSVLLCSSLPSIAHVETFLRRGMTIVAFRPDRQLGDPPLTNISVDNSLGAQLATNHLLELGHRRLAFVSGTVASVNRQERLDGFRRALDHAGLPAGGGTGPPRRQRPRRRPDAAAAGRQPLGSCSAPRRPHRHRGEQRHVRHRGLRRRP